MTQDNSRIAEYQKKIELLTSEIQNLEKKLAPIPWWRLGLLIFGLAVPFFIWQWLNLASLIFIIPFILVVLKERKWKDELFKLQQLKEFNENEQLFLKSGKYNANEAHRLTEKIENYAFSNDLDLFGEHSLFEFINRCQNILAKNKLAQLLISTPTLQEINERQIAVKELSQKNKFREDYILASSLRKATKSYEKRAFDSFIAWLKNEEKPISKIAHILAYIMPIVTLTTIFYAFAGQISFNWLWLPFIFNGLILNSQKDKITKAIEGVDGKAEALKVLALQLSTLEDETFESPLLQKLVTSIQLEQEKASNIINKIEKISANLELRYNVLPWIIFNLLFFWDIHYINKLNRWKNQYKKLPSIWIENTAEMEVLVSFGQLAYNQSEWVFPTISENLKLQANEVGHPLIKEKDRVNNPINIKKQGNIYVITGSNMAGKSTYLRTVGVNLILAYAGLPVCAKSFECGIFNIVCSMRVSDSLEDNTSTFYAELKKLKFVLEEANQKSNTLFLLDEILRGTNSEDRHKGSVALLKQMVKYNSTGFIATHDLALGDLQNQYPEHLDNFHFDVAIENEEMFFDYKIKEGVCKSFNASILMRKMGIEV